MVNIELVSLPLPSLTRSLIPSLLLPFPSSPLPLPSSSQLMSHRDQGKYKDAVLYLQDALGIRERVAPNNKPAVSALSSGACRGDL